MFSVQYKHIDFLKPWWFCLLIFPEYWITTILLRVPLAIFSASFILLLSWAVIEQDVRILYYVAGGSLIAYICELLLSKINFWYQYSVFQSIRNSATKRVLAADPIYHSTKSSGALVAKISSTALQYRELIFIATYQILVWLVKLFTVAFTIAFIDRISGVITLVGFVLVCITSIIPQLQMYKATKDHINMAAQTLMESFVQNMQQIALIRSTFQTQQRGNLTINKAQELAYSIYSRWTMMNGIFLVNLLIFVATHFVLYLHLQGLIESDVIDRNVAAALITNSIVVGSVSMEFGEMARSLSNIISKTTDLFEYMRSVGDSSFPSV